MMYETMDLEETKDDPAFAIDKLSDFIRSVAECKICYGILKNAKETNCCHTVFCEACISQWVNVSRGTCPICRVFLYLFQT